MRLQILLILLINFLFSYILKAQNAEKIVFRYSCVPTSTIDYSIEILREKFTLIHNEKLPNKKGKITKVLSSNYTHLFDSNEKLTLDSIIKVNSLDSIGLYQNRLTEWGTVWQIEIERNSITYKISLPNFNNAGLESLIRFVVCLIPGRSLPRFECKKCNKI